MSLSRALSRSCRRTSATATAIVTAVARSNGVTRAQVGTLSRARGYTTRISNYRLSIPTRTYPRSNRPGHLSCSVHLGNRRWVSSNRGDEGRSEWEDLGVPSTIIEKLQSHYPHIQNPTMAQRAFLLSLTGGQDRDIFLRDGMGRGKTFALALASLILASRSRGMARILILAPSIQLVEQIRTHLSNLSPDSLSHDLEGMIHMTTPQNILREPRPHPTLRWSTVMIDEPESMLAPLPSRHLPPPALKSHPFNRHPPPLATCLDKLRDPHAKGSKGPRMVWVGAEMNSLLKRVVRQRGWTGMDSLELDFGIGPSGRAKKDIETTLSHFSSVSRGLTGGTTGITPTRTRTEMTTSNMRTGVKHSALVVGPDGRFVEYIPNSILGATTTLPDYRSGRPDIDQTMIEAIMTLEDQYYDDQGWLSTTGAGETETEKRSGSTSLILPPEGYPLDLLAAQIQATATSLNSPLTCSVLDPATSTTSTSTITSLNTLGSSGPSLVIAPRSSIAGLDLPNLGRIYLINALDLAGLSPSQRARGGLKRRLGWYEIVQGRLGRLGSRTEMGGGEVVSLVTRGLGEEVGLDAILSTRRPNDT